MGKIYTTEYSEFTTITCLDKYHLLLEDDYKGIIINSLRFLSEANRIRVYGFVIMSNHLHLIWQVLGKHTRPNVQRDFLKFTAQQILKRLRTERSAVLESLLVNAKDRRCQVWARNSLSILLWSPHVFWQKLDYIHNNPVKARLCRYPENYKYSSAAFYNLGDKSWKFLHHHED